MSKYKICPVIKPEEYIGCISCPHKHVHIEGPGCRDNCGYILKFKCRNATKPEIEEARIRSI